jgi:hypothetical protein
MLSSSATLLRLEHEVLQGDPPLAPLPPKTEEHGPLHSGPQRLHVDPERGLHERVLWAQQMDRRRTDLPPAARREPAAGKITRVTSSRLRTPVSSHRFIVGSPGMGQVVSRVQTSWRRASARWACWKAMPNWHADPAVIRHGPSRETEPCHRGGPDQLAIAGDLDRVPNPGCLPARMGFARGTAVVRWRHHDCQRQALRSGLPPHESTRRTTQDMNDGRGRHAVAPW